METDGINHLWNKPSANDDMNKGILKFKTMAIWVGTFLLVLPAMIAFSFRPHSVTDENANPK